MRVWVLFSGKRLFRPLLFVELFTPLYWRRFYVSLLVRQLRIPQCISYYTKLLTTKQEKNKFHFMVVGVVLQHLPYHPLLTISGTFPFMVPERI